MAILPKPRRWYRRIFWSRLTFEIIIGMASLTATVISSHAALAKPGDQVTAADRALIACGAITFIVVLAKAVQDYQNERDKESVEPIEGIIDTLWTLLVKTGENGNSADLRMCVHILDRGRFYQLTDYCTNGHRDGRGRYFSMEKGIAGLAIRQWGLAVDKLSDGQDQIGHLVNRWGFTRQEAATLKQDRQSWAAVPIGQQGRPLCVIYCDSSRADFFGNSGSFRQQILEFSGAAIAEFVAHDTNEQGNCICATEVYPMFNWITKRIQSRRLSIPSVRIPSTSVTVNQALNSRDRELIASGAVVFTPIPEDVQAAVSEVMREHGLTDK